jgi:hypothetical protein
VNALYLHVRQFANGGAEAGGTASGG